MRLHSGIGRPSITTVKNWWHPSSTPTCNTKSMRLSLTLTASAKVTFRNNSAKLSCSTNSSKQIVTPRLMSFYQTLFSSNSWPKIKSYLQKALSLWSVSKKNWYNRNCNFENSQFHLNGPRWLKHTTNHCPSNCPYLWFSAPNSLICSRCL